MNDPSKRSDIHSENTPSQTDLTADETATPPLSADSNEISVDYAPDQVDVYGMTDVGHRRENNQDQFLIARLHKSMQVDATSLPLPARIDGAARGHVIMVADGMGGHAGGAVASELAIDSMVSHLLDTIHWHFNGDAGEPAFIRSLQRMLREAHAKILIKSAHDSENRGMGTTCTMAYLVWPTMYVVHAGDSRCYVVSHQQDGRRHAKQITTDHTMARRMVESGGLKPEEEATSRWSNVLWNVLGGNTDSDIIADVHRVDLSPGDSVVLCSDGLHRYLSPEQLGDVIAQQKSARDTAKHLVQHALQRGGEDNVTAVVFRSPNKFLDETTWSENFDDPSDTHKPDNVDKL